MKQREKPIRSFIIDVFVQPKSSMDEIVGMYDGKLKVLVTSPPERGKANERLKELLARKIGIRKSQVEIISGKSSRRKRILLRNISQGDLVTLLPHPEKGEAYRIES